MMVLVLPFIGFSLACFGAWLDPNPWSVGVVGFTGGVLASMIALFSGVRHGR